MERLEEYQRKRDFDVTPEPAGGVAADASERRFVVHKHAASRLHYDLRLEQDGVLRSWALPKGPSLTPGEKRLAVQVEDHPLEYGEFEGTIPAGQYGGGTIMLWDRGRWTAVGKGVSDDRIDIALDGEKLRGAWTLTRTRGRGDGTEWLLIKRRDRGSDPLRPHDRSVMTGRTMEEIARGEERPPEAAEGDGTRADVAPNPRAPAARASGARAPGARAPAAQAPDPRVRASDPGRLPGARRGPLPAVPDLQLATLSEEAPAGDGWIHEIKFDGYRLAARIEEGQVRLFTRNGHDWTARFPEVAAALGTLDVHRALLDGEVVAMGEGGVTSFRALQEALSAGETAGLRYQAFDLLHLEDHDLRGVPQAARKEALAELLAAAHAAAPGAVRYTDHVDGRGAAFLQRACRLGLEGIVSKRRDAPYRSGRGTRWLKTKCTRSEEFVVGGFTPPAGSRHAFGSLLLGYHHDDALVYAGRVGSGFSDRQLGRLHERLRPLVRPTSPFAGAVPDARDATWVEPLLVVEVAFTEQTRDGRLRHPTFRGVRDDKAPSEIVAAPSGGRQRQEGPATRTGGAREGTQRGGEGAPGDEGAKAAGPGRGARRPARRGGDDAEVAGVRLSNATRVLYPEQGITKLALARYYERVADHVLPGMAGRPLALVRCPQGHGEGCFYQKHPGDAFPRDLPRVPIAEGSGTREYAYVETIADLIGLVQAGVLEVHVWGCRIDEVERPDLMVIDLDPGPGVPWARTRDTALALRDRLADLGLVGFARTTGGKGLHVVVPIARRHDWDELKTFARALCERHAQDDREHLVTTASKAKRQGKIYLDYLRNGRGATAIASYSTRARPGAPVATPVRWDELTAALRPDGYDVGNVRRRLSALRADPWEGFAAAARPIDAAMRAAVGLR
jgi:bifunctional non-homologous end joining protein LigD